jgi:transcriptional regulator with XRE-family HTH domain
VFSPARLPARQAIGQRLNAVRELRNKRGLSQEDLAHKAGITTGTLSIIERGRSNPTWGTVKAIATALDTSLGELDALADKSSNR